MAWRIVLFNQHPNKDHINNLLYIARTLGFEVVVSRSCKDAWNLESHVMDFILATYPKTAPEYFGVLETKLEALKITTFADLGRFTLAEIWRAIVPTLPGAMFSRLLRAMRSIGATFSDWDTEAEKPIDEIEALTLRAVSRLNDNGIDDVAILKRLEDDDIRSLRGIGKKGITYSNIVEVRSKL